MADSNKLQTMMSSKTLVKATFKDYRNNLISFIDTNTYGYAIYSDAVAHFLTITVSNAPHPKPPVSYLTQFLTTMHLHNIPTEERNKLAKICIEQYCTEYVG